MPLKENQPSTPQEIDAIAKKITETAQDILKKENLLKQFAGGNLLPDKGSKIKMAISELRRKEASLKSKLGQMKQSSPGKVP